MVFTKFPLVKMASVPSVRLVAAMARGLSHSSICFTGTAVLEYTANGTVQGSWGGRLPDAAPHGAYRCRGDDRWCVIAVFTDEEWTSFTKVLGNPLWTRENRFATLLGRKHNEDELDRLVENWTMQKDAREVMEILQSAGVAAGVIQSGKDLLEDDLQLKARGHFVQVEHPEAGSQTVDSVRIKLSSTPGRVRHPAPLLGEHNEHVLKELLGISGDEYDSLLIEGVVY